MIFQNSSHICVYPLIALIFNLVVVSNIFCMIIYILCSCDTVEQAGGQCLPCVMDVRHEDEVSKAVDLAVKRFGGIDIVVNNAGAISLTGTLNTSMKK